MYCLRRRNVDRHAGEGLYSGGQYVPGIEFASFALSGVVTEAQQS